MSQEFIRRNAPDFALTDVNGNVVRLSDYRGRQNIVLVFNRSVY